jgi:hypothetical protein
MDLTIAIKKAKFKNRTVSLKEIPVPTSFFYDLYKKKAQPQIILEIGLFPKNH